MDSLEHFVSARQLRKPVLDGLLRNIRGLAHFPVKDGLPQVQEAKRVVLLFYGPETRRTYDSFEFAITDLGWTAGGGMRAEQFSGMVQGDSFEHAMRFYGKWSHGIVLRHHDAQAPERATKYARVPIVSAGGSKEGEHPTQALGDFALLREVIGGCGGKEVSFVGNLRDSSSVHSLCYLLRHDMPRELYVVAPDGQGLQDEYAQALKRVTQVDSVANLPASTRAIYLVQSPDAADASRFHLTRDALDRFSEVRVLHPLPEGAELPKELFEDPRVVTEQQMDYVQFARMACLEHFVGRKTTFK